MIMLTPVTSPVTSPSTNQNHAQADHTRYGPLPHCVFKKPSLKATGEFGSLEYELLLLLAWPQVEHLAKTAVFSFTKPSVIRWALLCIGQADLSLVQ